MPDNIAGLDFSWLLAGGALAGLASLVAASWSYIRAAANYLKSMMIVTIRIEGYFASKAAQCYMWQYASASPFGSRRFVFTSTFVKTTEKYSLVPYESLLEQDRFLWINKRPLWITKTGTNDTRTDNAGTSSDSAVQISFVRGLFSADKLVAAMGDHYNKCLSSETKSDAGRHYIYYRHGTANRLRDSRGGNEGRPAFAKSAHPADLPYLFMRPIGIEASNLGPRRRTDGEALSQLALSPEIAAAAKAAKRWYHSKDWFSERGIPWCYSWLLTGVQGNGKTSLARAIAEDLDLPVYVLDLPTFRNDELQEAWDETLVNSPCIVLLEDIDAVFSGRDTIKGDLTFDRFLNCLDGVRRNDGLFIIMTSNDISKLDAALCQVNEQNITTRPGRVDTVLTLHNPDEAGRIKIANRILLGCSEDLIQEVVYKGDGHTGAQFQKLCTDLALKQFHADD